MNRAAEPLPSVEAKVDETAGEAVGMSLPHESARLHVSGQAPYTDDLHAPAGTLHAALGLSPVAHGTLVALDLDRLRGLPGVVDVFSAAAIPGANNCGPLVADDPILAGEPGATLRYAGQPVFVVVATTRDAARRAAAQARQVIQAQPLPPVLSALQAHTDGQYVVPPMHLARGDVATALRSAPHRVHTTFSMGGQEHFYLEGQVALALPAENGGIQLCCSTQHPSEMQAVVAHMLHRPAHAVQVECRRMGGGFGGKESQSAVIACVAALAAERLQRPVKLRLDRDDDFVVTGHRHPFHVDIEAGHDDQGRVLAVRATLVADAGHSADLSGPVLTRALCHFDNAYWLPHVELHGYAARTHKASNTAFRGFGGPQGAIAIEHLLDLVARRLGLDPLAVRRANFYGEHEQNLTPYGQPVADNQLQRLTQQLVDSSGYAERRAAAATFNATSPVLKKGLALTPLKFGISFNLPHLNQAGALVHVYTDGSVLVNHGGTEMGQGLNTKVAQVVAHELGLPLSAVRVTATDTHKVANTSATAASTGSDLNGKAAQDAARQLRERLAAVAAAHWADRGVAAADVVLAGGQARAGAHRLAFAALVNLAYQQRVQLWSDGFYATPGLSWDRQTLQGRPFFYFAYGAAVAEVLLDTLTGEWKLLQADLLHDAGRSLNPALDIGQVEGAFVQGMGWLTMEELVWHPTSGALMTHAPSTYKIPTANDVPALFCTRLYDQPNAADSIHHSKAVGEPPLLLGFAPFFALRDAVAAAGPAGVDVPLNAPATPEALLHAVQAVQALRADAVAATRAEVRTEPPAQAGAQAPAQAGPPSAPAA